MIDDNDNFVGADPCVRPLTDILLLSGRGDPAPTIF